MKVGHIKGALLEYIIREILKNCGFTNVSPDDLYTYKDKGLVFVNGKGAAHDTDILMDPPFQMPFSYPNRLIIECKAYEKEAGLPIVRNALGLREDINSFEIVTKETIKERKNSRRADIAIEKRNRYLYQVGVASLNDFTKPAIEFATNNKIPLFSLSWFFETSALSNFNSINQDDIDLIPVDTLQNVYDFLKDRDGDMYSDKYTSARMFLRNGNKIGVIITLLETILRNAFIGLTESGDFILIYTRDPQNNILRDSSDNLFSAQIYYITNRENIWRLNLKSKNSNQESNYDFYLPKIIYDTWKNYSFDKKIAINLKEQYFSKIYIFSKTHNMDLPFKLINIDRDWLSEIKELNE